MADLTLPGDIPTIPAVVNGHVLVRGCSPVECSRYITADETPVRGVVVALNGPRRAFVAMPLPSLFVRDVPLTSLALRLDDPTGRAHAAWWVRDNFCGDWGQLAREIGEVWTRCELAHRWSAMGVNVSDEQIGTLRRIVLHVAGRTDND